MIPRSERDGVRRAVEALLESSSTLFITGAGVSADSGLPTYRGVGGLYDVETTSEGYAIEEILTAETLQHDPALTWKHLLEIGKACHGATFNRAHQIIAEAETCFERVLVLTQNVDGFHTEAGSKKVIDIHGDMRELVCTRCDFRECVSSDSEPRIPPPCPQCDSVVRPDIVLFGEMLPAHKSERLYNELRMGFDVVFSIGTSSLFEYIAWPIHLAKDTGKCTVEINPVETSVSSLVDIRIPLGASAALEQIWDHYRRMRA
ncbi:MAG: NAD-dependent protein deacylase [Planctomycetaceae bacterium]|nr:NAD-dependent protein deacylase [Planctomycetaceae bacterium]